MWPTPRYDLPLEGTIALGRREGYGVQQRLDEVSPRSNTLLVQTYGASAVSLPVQHQKLTLEWALRTRKIDGSEVIRNLFMCTSMSGFQ